jgi:DNA-binding transcriptional MerR regulator/methylmalonyl-CoA mutase cobalamin-binding subunit
MTYAHPIQVVARRTGLTPHVLRVWEKRYGAVLPHRTQTNRRLYSEADIQRLMLLRRATLSGRNIGQVAQLSTKELSALLSVDERSVGSAPVVKHGSLDEGALQFHRESCLYAVEHLDAARLEEGLNRAAVTFSQTIVLERIIAPLITQIGELCHDGTLRIANEHMASAVIRGFLDNLRGRSGRSLTAPHLLVVTPTGQWHELGALLVAAVAVSEGWRVTYLGVNLPVEEIVGAMHQQQAKAVALSIVYPADDLSLGNELRNLRRLMPTDLAILVGGRAAGGYREVLEEIGATLLGDLPSLRVALGALRT